MAMTPSDFSKIWASNADTPEYTFTEANYLKGWDFVGNFPPTRAMWNAMQKSTDEKMKYVFDNFGAPLTASTVAEMTMQNRVYVYTGSETGYTAGHWYYWNGSAWADGGVYNSNTVQVDPTLTISGAAADAKETGKSMERICSNLYGTNGTNNLKWELGTYNDSTGAKINLDTRGRTNIMKVYGKYITIDNIPNNIQIRCFYYKNGVYHTFSVWNSNTTTLTLSNGDNEIALSATYVTAAGDMDLSLLSAVTVLESGSKLDNAYLVANESQAGAQRAEDLILNGVNIEKVRCWSHGNVDQGQIKRDTKKVIISEPIRLSGTRIAHSAPASGYHVKMAFFKDGVYVRQTIYHTSAYLEAYSLDDINEVRFVCYNDDNTDIDLDELGDLFTFYCNSNYLIDNINIASNRIDNINQEIVLMNSKNLLVKNYNGTSYGITVSLSNGIVTLNGTCTESTGTTTYFDLSRISGILLESNKHYVLSVEGIETAREFTLMLYLNYGSGLVKFKEDIHGKFEFNTGSGLTDALLRLHVRKNGQTYTNKKIRITVSENPSNRDNALNYAEVRFLECFGTGDCTIFKFKDGKVLVIDFGLDETQGLLYRSWIRATEELNITHIDYAIISHYHRDHVGMLLKGGVGENLIDENTVFFLPQAWTAEDIAGIQWVDQMARDTIYEHYTQVLALLNRKGCKIVNPIENEEWVIDRQVNLRFWNANHDQYLTMFKNHEMYDYNNASLCNYVEIGSVRMCFSGDAGVLALENFKTSALPSQIFKVNHHSVGYSVVPQFMNCLMPDVSISMLGANMARSSLGSNPNQLWHEANHIPHINTGILGHTVSMRITEHNWIFNNSCRRCIIADEDLQTD